MMTRHDIAAMGGTTHATRHADVVLVHWTHPSEWRFATTSREDAYVVPTGASYVSRIEALSDPRSILAYYDRSEA